MKVSETLTVKALKTPKVTVKGAKKAIKVAVKAFVTSGKKIAYSKATIVKCTSNNSDNNKAKVCKINGTNCNVGDTITVALNMKTPKVLVNFQGYTDFDSSNLKFVSAKINANGGLINCVNNTIYYNGSNISKGYELYNHRYALHSNL